MMRAAMKASTASEYNAQMWAQFSAKEDTRKRKARELILIEPPGKILDIGCVRGEFLQPLIKKGWSAYGIELDARQAERARANGVDAKSCDVTHGLPFPDETFDCVYAGEVIEHLIDTDHFISEIHRVTKKGGCVILTTPNLASLHNRIRLLLGKYPVWVEYRLGGEGHVRAYTIEVMKSQLALHGFATERVRGNYIVFVPQRFLPNPDIPKLAFLSDWFPSLSTCMIVKARKTT